MDLKRPSYQRTVQWTMQGLMESFSEKKKKHCLVLEYVKLSIWLSLITLGWSAGQILVQKFTKFEHPHETVPTW